MLHVTLFSLIHGSERQESVWYAACGCKYSYILSGFLTFDKKK